MTKNKSMKVPLITLIIGMSIHITLISVALTLLIPLLKTFNIFSIITLIVIACIASLGISNKIVFGRVW